MVKLRASACALGLEATCLGSVTAWGAGNVWAATVSARTVFMSMTIANEMRMRMRIRSLEVEAPKNSSRRSDAQRSLSFRILMHLHGAPGLVGGVAEVFEGAVYAPRLAGDAELASVPDDLVGKENPPFARDNAHQVLLDFLRVTVRGEFEAPRDAVHMSIDD